MKTNSKKKIVVSVLALAMGAGIAGSISGSIAWYQYSTRAYAVINGTSVGTMGRLGIKLASEEDTAYTNNKPLDPVNFKPVSVTRNEGTLAFLDQPVYQVPTLPAADPNNAPYVDYVFNFRFQESSDGSSWTDQATRNIYLAHFDVVNDSSAKDISGAVRVAFYEGNSTTAKAVLAKDSAKVTTTHGSLDLNGNGNPDTALYDLSDSDYATNAIDYTNGADSYTTDAHASWVLTTAEMANIYTLDTTVADKALCTTAETLKVRVWLEGWELFGQPGSASWDSSYIAQNFDLQLQFICQADR